MKLSEIIASAKAAEVTLERKAAPIVVKPTTDTVPAIDTLTSLTASRMDVVAHLSSGVGNDWTDRNVPVPIARIDGVLGCDRFAVEGEARTDEELGAIHAAITDSFAGFVAMATVRVNVSENIRKAIQHGATFADFERYTLAAMPSSWEEKDATKGRRAGLYVARSSPAGRYLSLVRTIMSELGMKKAPQTAEEKEAAKTKRIDAQIKALAKEGYVTSRVRDPEKARK